jgi:hypothetical protein
MLADETLATVVDLVRRDNCDIGVGELHADMGRTREPT